MGEKERLRVTFSSEARENLSQILSWSAESFGPKIAQGYVEFLTEEIMSLALGHASSRTVPTRPNLRYKIIRRHTSRNGHIVIFRVAPEEIEVLHIFHTAQDWINKL